MSVERVIRAAAKPLLGKLVRSLDRDDLYQVGRIALWQAGDKPPDYQTVIARSAMRDELRRHRWIGRSTKGDASMQEMASYDDLEELPDMMTDDESASMVAVRQFIAHVHRLTDRQRDVLSALTSGMHQAEVARTLGISEKRVSQLVGDLRAVVARYV